MEKRQAHLCPGGSITASSQLLIGHIVGDCIGLGQKGAIAALERRDLEHCAGLSYKICFNIENVKCVAGLSAQ
jgi:hypothetical protein